MDRKVSIEIEFDADGGILAVRRLDDEVKKTVGDTEKLGRETKNTTGLMQRGFRAVGRTVNIALRAFNAVRRSLFTIRFLVLGFFVRQFVGVLTNFLGKTVELETAEFRLAAAVRAAQIRFGTQIQTIKETLALVPRLRREFKQFSTIELTNTTATVAELQRNFGITGEQAPRMLRRIIDTAEATGRTIEDVVNRIRSGFLGSTEAIEDLGVNFKITRLQNDALTQGLQGQFTAMKDTTQAQVRYNAFMEDTAQLQGVAAEAAQTLGGRIKTLNAFWDDFLLLLSSSITQTRLFKTLLEGVQNVVGFMTGEVKELSTAGQFMLGVFNGLLGLFGGILSVLFKSKEIIENSGDFTEFFANFADAFNQGFDSAQLKPEQFVAKVTDLIKDSFGAGLKPDPVDVDKAVEALSSFTEAIIAQFSRSKTDLGGLILFNPATMEKQIQSAFNFLRKAQARLNSQVASANPNDVGAVAKLVEQRVALAEVESQLGTLRQALLALSTGDFTAELITQLEALGFKFEEVIMKGKLFTLSFEGMESQVTDISGVIQNAIQSTLTSVGDLFADLVSGADDPLKKFFAGLLGIVGDFMIALGIALIPLAHALIALKTLNPYAMIAVAAGLIIVGGILKGFSSKIGGTGGGGGSSFQSGIARPTGPESVQLNLESIPLRQGQPQAQVAAAQANGVIGTLERVNSTLDRFDTKPEGVIVKDGVDQNGGVFRLTSSEDRQSVTETVHDIAEV